MLATTEKIKDNEKQNAFIKLAIRKDEKDKFSKIAKKRGISVSALIREFIHMYIKSDWIYEKAQRKAEYSADFKRELEMAKKLIGYVRNYHLKMAMRWMMISGLGSKELFSIKYSDLRYLDYSNDLVRIDVERVKPSVNFTTFIYGNVKDSIQKYIETNKDAKDSDYWLNEEPEKAYHRYEKMFSNAYRNMVIQEYPEPLSAQKKVFTLNSYRSIFITICRDLRVPLHIENRFVAHSDDRLTGAYASAKDLESNFKMIQEELLDVRIFKWNLLKKINKKRGLIGNGFSS